MDNNISNIQQERAKYAFQKANEKSKDYPSYVKIFPMYIKVNGFSNAMAFAYNKAFGGNNINKDWEKLYFDIGNWLKTEPQGIIRAELQDFTDKNRNLLMYKLVSLETEKLRMVTAETLSMLNWLRRFVKDE